MMGQQCRSESLFYYFRIEDHVPEHHLLRAIDRYVNFDFVRQRLKTYYSELDDRRSTPSVCFESC
jgi:transposase